MTNTPTPDLSREALEALARDVEEYGGGYVPPLTHVAATLRALARVQPEPAPDVAALVEEAHTNALRLGLVADGLQKVGMPAIALHAVEIALWVEQRLASALVAQHAFAAHQCAVRDVSERRMNAAEARVARLEEALRRIAEGGKSCSRLASNPHQCSRWLIACAALKPEEGA